MKLDEVIQIIRAKMIREEVRINEFIVGYKMSYDDIGWAGNALLFPQTMGAKVKCRSR